MSKIILPIIKKAMPTLLVQDIVGVESLTKKPRFRIQKVHLENVPDGYLVLEMMWPCWDIREWLGTQDLDKWWESKNNHGLSRYLTYVISEDLYTLLTLKFS